ncbi:ABC transporter C family member 2-like isoform X2 [Populus alba x Populus x berolinensis]|nr:ABC transporter C family member 2-like isoform X2 [Populus alba x Populus x berolinensis]KAJ6886273.1 ABC transporter C family member 2-like isoform X2 [Populus alba x Populus x berolinensis]
MAEQRGSYNNLCIFTDPSEQAHVFSSNGRSNFYGNEELNKHKRREVKMGFEALDWYCKPVRDGVWTKAVENAFGAYTPCATDTLVVSLSYLVLMALCFYKIWLTKKDFKLQRFCLRSKWYAYLLALLALYSTAEPLYRLVMGISVLNLDGQTGLAPFECLNLYRGKFYVCGSTLIHDKEKRMKAMMARPWNLDYFGDDKKHHISPLEIVSLIIEALAWCSLLVMIVVEIKVYIREFRWFVRFGVIYTLVGDAVMLNLILTVKEFYNNAVLHLYISEVIVQVCFYLPILSSSLKDTPVFGFPYPSNIYLGS